VEGLSLRLRALDPIATLGRGFSIVHLPHTGVVVSSTKQVEIGDALEITVADGSLLAVAGDGIPDQKPKYTTARSKETRPRPKARPNQPSGMAPLL